MHRHPYRPSGGSGADVDGNGDIGSGADGRGAGGGSIAGWVAAVATTVVKVLMAVPRTSARKAKAAAAKKCWRGERGINLSRPPFSQDRLAAFLVLFDCGEEIDGGEGAGAMVEVAAAMVVVQYRYGE